MAKKELTHEEVWDDSALVNSWNAALEEYKKYHSLAARGEKVEVVLDEAEKGAFDDDDQATAKEVEDKSASTQLNGLATQKHENDAAPMKTNAVGEASNSQAGSAQTAPSGNAIPQALLNSVQDEGLKNIMMSWYYAGYYTGLYEGQQKAYASMQYDG